MSEKYAFLRASEIPPPIDYTERVLSCIYFGCRTGAACDHIVTQNLKDNKFTDVNEWYGGKSLVL